MGAIAALATLIVLMSGGGGIQTHPNIDEALVSQLPHQVDLAALSNQSVPSVPGCKFDGFVQGDDRLPVDCGTGLDSEGVNTGDGMIYNGSDVNGAPRGLNCRSSKGVVLCTLFTGSVLLQSQEASGEQAAVSLIEEMARMAIDATGGSTGNS